MSSFASSFSAATSSTNVSRACFCRVSSCSHFAAAERASDKASVSSDCAFTEEAEAASALPLRSSVSATKDSDASLVFSSWAPESWCAAASCICSDSEARSEEISASVPTEKRPPSQVKLAEMLSRTSPRC